MLVSGVVLFLPEIQSSPDFSPGTHGKTLIRYIKGEAVSIWQFRGAVS
jgi:hypothetical protein